MDSHVVGLIGLGVMLLMMGLGVPVAISLIVPAVIGLLWLVGFEGTAELLTSHTFRYASSFSFSAVPLFLLMGYAAMHSGITSRAYDSARVLLSWLPGGLAMATSVASGAFGACMGSGIPAAATLSRIAIPEMLRYGYDKKLAAGSVAASAGVAVLIPPSVAMVVYAVFTEVSLGKMILAGYLPGLLSICMFMVYIGAMCTWKPALCGGITRESHAFREYLTALRDTWGIAVLVAILFGGIYTGYFTATEAAALGAASAFCLMFVTRAFKWSAVKGAFDEALRVTSMAFLMMVGGVILVVFMSASGLPKYLTELIVQANLGLYPFMALVILLYLFLGFALPSMVMLMITLPILLPVLHSFNVDLIWFGIIYIKMSEVAALTPPEGMGLFVVKAVVGDAIPMSDIMKGIGGFVAVELVTTALLIAFPAISLWLPNTLRGG